MISFAAVASVKKKLAEELNQRKAEISFAAVASVEKKLARELSRASQA